jgi:ATP-dependent Clp protease protease subunit
MTKMTRLAEKAGKAGDFIPQKKLGIVASFVAAACMIASACAWAGPEAQKDTDSRTTPEQAETLRKAANSNFKGIQYEEKWTVRLSGSINDGNARQVIDQLRALNREDPDHEITLIINSEGGSVAAAMAVYDTMQSIKNDVRTVCEARAMSMGAVLLAGGTPSKREAYQNCEIMIHEVSSNISGRLSNLKTWADDTYRGNERLIDVLHRHTGISKEDLRDAMIVDVVFTSVQEAKDFGLVDNIIPSKKMEPSPPRKIPGEFCKVPERQRLRICTAPSPSNSSN